MIRIKKEDIQNRPISPRGNTSRPVSPQPSGSALGTEIKTHGLDRIIQLSIKELSLSGLRVFDTVLFNAQGQGRHEKKNLPYASTFLNANSQPIQNKRDELHRSAAGQSLTQSTQATIGANASLQVMGGAMGSGAEFHATQGDFARAHGHQIEELVITHDERPNQLHFSAEEAFSAQAKQILLNNHQLTQSFIEKYGSHFVSAIYYGRARQSAIHLDSTRVQQTHGGDIHTTVPNVANANVNIEDSRRLSHDGYQAHTTSLGDGQTAVPIRYDLTPWSGFNIVISNEVQVKFERSALEALVQQDLEEQLNRWIFVAAFEQLHKGVGNSNFIYYWLTELLFSVRLLPLLVICFQEKKDLAWNTIRDSYNRYSPLIPMSGQRDFLTQIEKLACTIAKSESLSLRWAGEKAADHPNSFLSISGKEGGADMTIYQHKNDASSLPDGAKWQFQFPPNDGAGFFWRTQEDSCHFIISPAPDNFVDNNVRKHKNKNLTGAGLDEAKKYKKDSTWLLMPVLFAENGSKKRKVEESEPTKSAWTVYWKLSSQAYPKNSLYVTEPNVINNLSVKVNVDVDNERNLFSIQPV